MLNYIDLYGQEGFMSAQEESITDEQDETFKQQGWPPPKRILKKIQRIKCKPKVRLATCQGMSRTMN